MCTETIVLVPFLQILCTLCPCVYLLWEKCFRHILWCLNNLRCIRVTQPAILYGPRWPPQIAIEDRKHAEFTVLAAGIHSKLLDIESNVGVSFIRKFQEMLDRDSLNKTVTAQDPQVPRSRERPHRSGRSLFRDGRNVV